MSYTPYYAGGWQSGQSGGTPITPEALNHMDAGIRDAYVYAVEKIAAAIAGLGSAEAMQVLTNRINELVASQGTGASHVYEFTPIGLGDAATGTITVDGINAVVQIKNAALSFDSTTITELEVTQLPETCRPVHTGVLGTYLLYNFTEDVMRRSDVAYLVDKNYLLKLSLKSDFTHSADGLTLTFNYQLLNPSLFELNDLRVGYDGTVYETAGEAVRAQVQAAMENGGGSSSGNEYELPVAGAELGGVKNGGNVVINEDGTMTAPESTTGGTSAEVGYKWAARGYMREHVREFQGWAHCVRFDPDLGKAVGLVLSGTGSHSNTAPYYRVEIDPATGYMSDYVEVVMNYPEGSENTDCGYIGSFVIKPDGTYWICDYYKRIFTSSDKGYTWDYVSSITLGRDTFDNDFLFGAIRLSNGYMVAGNGGNPAAETYYSTDDGVTWNVVTMDRSGLGQQVYPDGNYIPFEPFFVDCGDGKVIQYARASMNAYKTYADGSCTVKEAACYSISEDYGLTWTAWQWSDAITDMTACNGRAVVIGDKVHAVYGSRYHAEDNHFHLFYAATTLTDILNDKWETPSVVEVGHWDSETATNDHDCGYPSLFADGNNNLFAVYYDSDGTGSAFGANWRLCIGTQAAAQVAPVTNEGTGSTVVGYTQLAVDKLIQGLLSKINDLYLKLGEVPESSGDGTFPITDGLVEWFEPGDESQWADKVVNSKISSGHTAQGLSNNGATAIYTANLTAPTEFAGNMCAGGILFDATAAEYGVVDALTMEFVMDMADNQVHVLLLQSPIKTSGSNTGVYTHNNNFNDGNGYIKTACHMAVVFTLDATKVYRDGVLRETLDALTAEQFAAAHPICRACYGAVGGVRMYNRALTEDEIRNNYKYASTLTAFGTDYFS